MRMRWTEHVARIGEMRNAYKISVGKLEGKRPLGRSRRRSEDNAGMVLGDMRQKDVNWIQVAQDRGQWHAHVNTVMNLRVS